MNAERMPIDPNALRTAKLNPSSTPKNPVVIESRFHLAAALAEAAETEHNLMCLYIYATFSLKRSTEEGVTAEELKSIESWRRVVMGISLEEMTHLCLVMNLFAALGATSHFKPPNFPIISGLFPADFVMELAPFDLDAIEHFIFLERPAAYDIKDSDAFLPEKRYERVAPLNRMMPAPGDYKTIGILYGAIRDALVQLANKLGEKALF
ncbi:MAG: ferritin-like domain-containing protein, partial [Bdellovibrionota bacterium]